MSGHYGHLAGENGNKRTYRRIDNTGHRAQIRTSKNLLLSRCPRQSEGMSLSCPPAFKFQSVSSSQTEEKVDYRAGPVEFSCQIIAIHGVRACQVRF